MKQRIFTLLFLCSCCLGSHVSAQITLDANDIPVVGDVVTYMSDTMVSGIDIGMPGANQTWDFSTAVGDISTTTSFLDPSGLPGASEFPSANIAVDAEGVISFAEITANEVLNLGAFIDVFMDGNPFVAAFEPPQRLFEIPTTYNTTWSNTYAIDVTADGSDLGVDSVRFKSQTTRDVTYDAYGTVITPVDSYDALRETSFETVTDSIWVKFFGVWTLFSDSEETSTQYQWISKESKGSLVDVSLDDMGQVEAITYFSSINNGGGAAPVASFTYTNQGDGVVDFLDVSGNSPTSWLWDFGDGNSSTQQNPTHTYSSPGTYTVCLTVSNAEGSDFICVNLTINLAPEALFAYNDNGEGDFDFEDLSSNDPTAWAWDFGDGGSSTLQNPSYTYSLPGDYTVCLTATNDEGSDMYCEEVAVAIPPVADFTFSNQTPDGTVSFMDASTLNPTSWDWDFDDGGTSTEQNPDHMFELAGDYNVCLTVSNGLESTVCKTVTIVIISTKEIPGLHNLTVGPNPAMDLVRFQLEDSQGEALILDIRNALGETVVERSWNSTTDVAVANWPAGVYVYSIRNTKGQVLQAGKLQVLK